MYPDFKEQFLEYHRNISKKLTGKTVYQILSDVMEPMIKNKHPRLKYALEALKYNRYCRDKDWIAAVLSELGAIEYTSCNRLQNANGRPRKSAIVSICIVLGLNLEKSTELLAAAGHTFRKGNNLDEAYSFLIEDSHQDAEKMEYRERLYAHSLIGEYNKKLLVIAQEVKTLDLLGPAPAAKRKGK